MTAPTPTRSAAIDSVRIIGIIAVIVGHTWETEMFQRLIYSWQVPIFFVLTGYFWTAIRPMRVEVHKRSLTLLRPYVFWLVAIATLVVAKAIAQGDTNGLASQLGKMLIGGSYAVRPFTAFWFATGLFFGAVGLRAMQRLPYWAQWSAALIMLAIAYIAPALVKGIPLAAGTGLACVVFVIAGTLFRRIHGHIPAAPVLGALAVGAGLLLAGFGITEFMSLKNAYFGTPVASVLVAVAISIGLILVAEWVIPKLGASTNDAITTVAACGLMVVLTHPVVLWVLSTPPSGSWLAFVLAVALPWATALVLLRTPLSPWALGVPQRGRLSSASSLGRHTRQSAN